jgi:segregation and condensation protein B
MSGRDPAAVALRALREQAQASLPVEGLDERPTPDEIARVPAQHLRILEAALFAAREPLGEGALAARLPFGADVAAALRLLAYDYAGRGVNLRRVEQAWAFRTAPDLAATLAEAPLEPKKLSRAAIETLAIIAYHQPTTRAEIEEIRGVGVSRNTLETLLEAGFIRLRGRRRAPGRPVTFGTTATFLDHFGLEQVGDLPGLHEMKAAGLLDARLPPGLDIPQPSDDDALRGDEDPLDEGDDRHATEALGPGDDDDRDNE